MVLTAFHGLPLNRDKNVYISIFCYKKINIYSPPHIGLPFALSFSVISALVGRRKTMIVIFYCSSYELSTLI